MGKATYLNGTTPDVCIVGAGFSEILAGIQLRKKLELETFTIFDENWDVGGTWLVNTYPGCECDIPSHIYAYSFGPNPYWSKNYSSQEEILTYLQNVAKKNDLYRHIELHTQVKSLRWDETLRKWRVVIFNKVKMSMEERQFDIVINSPGIHRVPNIPPEFESFKATILHSATWDASVKWEHKIVGVVGSGPSAIQIIPELAPKVKELHCFQRRPVWIMPKWQFQIKKWLQFLLANIPLLMLLLRWYYFLFREFFHNVFLHRSRLSRFVSSVAKKHLTGQIPENELLRQELIPRYSLGCKRLVVSSEYFPAIQRQNVMFHSEPILEVKHQSLVTSSGEQKLDVLVLATGYQSQSFFAPMEILGKNAVNVFEKWNEAGPSTYFGILSSTSPNLFYLMGPNTVIALIKAVTYEVLGHNSIIFMIECQMNYTIQLIREMMKLDSRVVEVKESAEHDFQDDVSLGMKNTVWGHDQCGSWYANGTGQMLWPYTCIKYWWMTRTPKFINFNFY